MRMMGARVRRKEDPRLITGSSTYVDDLRIQGMGHVGILRSIYGHAKINGIDTSAAKALPGVIAVYTGAEFKRFTGPMPHGGGEGAGGQKGQVAIQTWPIEPERVRHVGQAVAVVVAETRYIARDALDLIEVDYEPLPAVTNMEAALEPGAPQLYDDVPGNLVFQWNHIGGEPDKAFAEAEIVVTRKMTNQRVAGLSMEPRGVMAQPDALSGGLVVYTSTQNPHSVRQQIARTLGMSDIDLRVIAPEVGGGFGVKISAYPEEMIVTALARELKRPIKWMESRSEDLAATHHGRGQRGEVSIAAKRDGTILGVKLRAVLDVGAYPRAAGVGLNAGRLLTGVYAYQHADLEIKAAYTNTMPTGAYRGAGRPEAAYYIERIVDALADELGIDPVELRRRNFIPTDAFPYQTPTGPKYDSGDYDKPVTKVLELAGYDELLKKQANLRKEGRYLGIGTSTFTEICGFGPFDSASIRVEPSGRVTVATGISPHGQGQETTFAQIVADTLGVSMDDVIVVHGDTARTPAGQGTMGSRGLVVGGSALVMGLNQITDKVRKIVAHKLEADVADIELADGKFGVKGSPEQALNLKEIAAIAYSGTMPVEIGTGLEVTDFFAPPGTTYPFGADVVVVEVMPETGEVQVQRYVTVDDCGRVISPLLVDGQVHGGLAQGIGQALWEEVVYDDEGQLVTGTLMDYAVPRAQDFPHFELERTETPSPLNPLGAKGIGELATIGSTPAIVNAVLDALTPFGITELDMPLRPERIWKAIQNAQVK
ncbi:MAG: xanthine dehydrogenase family protein molybdopterin-binding subunit [Thermomicrobiales bacterium]